LAKQAAMPAFGSKNPLGTLLAVIDRRKRKAFPFCLLQVVIAHRPHRSLIADVI